MSLFRGIKIDLTVMSCMLWFTCRSSKGVLRVYMAHRSIPKAYTSAAFGEVGCVLIFAWPGWPGKGKKGGGRRR